MTPRADEMRPRRARFSALFTLALSIFSAAVVLGALNSKSVARATVMTNPIQHVVIVMQENRSFDEFFGTYPGADGLPPDTCMPDPLNGGCQRPYHDTNAVNKGAGHGAQSFRKDYNNGAMDGFVRNAERDGDRHPDVMGYHDASDLPNYWAYAQNFVLQDRMFAPTGSWSLPVHLYLVSAWSALCTDPADPFTCKSWIGGRQPGFGNGAGPFTWTDLTYLLHKSGISWRYYVTTGTQPDCDDGDASSCADKAQTPGTPSGWNPLPSFTTVKQNGELGNVQDSSQFFTAAANGTLPSVSWVIPSGPQSDHPPRSIKDGQAWVTSLINAVMQGPNWNSTAIFVSWDEWGGFYDHVAPPKVDHSGYGFRTPAFMISPYARRGYIDHQTLSFDAYLKFIEDLFLGRQRLDPANDGRPDPRPTVRENVPQLGDLMAEFDFSQAPRKPMVLPLYPG